MTRPSASVQFVELVREEYHRLEPRQFKEQAFCDGCGKFTLHYCWERGEWEERRCDKCEWQSSYRVR
jgi:hypothetical protein